MAWYPEYKKRRGLVVTGTIRAAGGFPAMSDEEILAAVDSDRLYPAGHPVTLARFRRAKDLTPRPPSLGGKGENVAAAVHQDTLKPYDCPALGQMIYSNSQRKRIMREHYEKTGVRLREFV